MVFWRWCLLVLVQGLIRAESLRVDVQPPEVPLARKETLRRERQPKGPSNSPPRSVKMPQEFAEAQSAWRAGFAAVDGGLEPRALLPQDQTSGVLEKMSRSGKWLARHFTLLDGVLSYLHPGQAWEDRRVLCDLHAAGDLQLLETFEDPETGTLQAEAPTADALCVVSLWSRDSQFSRQLRGRPGECEPWIQALQAASAAAQGGARAGIGLPLASEGLRGSPPLLGPARVVWSDHAFSQPDLASDGMLRYRPKARADNVGRTWAIVPRPVVTEAGPLRASAPAAESMAARLDRLSLGRHLAPGDLFFVANVGIGAAVIRAFTNAVENDLLPAILNVNHVGMVTHIEGPTSKGIFVVEMQPNGVYFRTLEDATMGSPELLVVRPMYRPGQQARAVRAMESFMSGNRTYTNWRAVNIGIFGGAVKAKTALEPGRMSKVQKQTLICSTLVLSALSEAGFLKSDISPWLSPNRVARIMLERLSTNKREVLFSEENEAEWAQHRSRPGQVVLYQRTEQGSCGAPRWADKAGPAELAHTRDGPWQVVGSVFGERYGHAELRLLYNDVWMHLQHFDRIARRGGVLCAEKRKTFGDEPYKVPAELADLHRLYLASVSFVADCQAKRQRLHAEAVLQAYMCADDLRLEGWPKFTENCLPDFGLDAVKSLSQTLTNVNLPLARLQAIRWKHID